MTSESSEISEREREILSLLATGATNKQIAHQLNISANTVRVHVRNIFGKLGVASRTEATVYAIQKGWLDVVSEEASDPEPSAPSTTSPRESTPIEQSSKERTATPEHHPISDTSPPNHIAYVPPAPATKAQIPPPQVPPPTMPPEVEQRPPQSATYQRGLLMVLGTLTIVLAAALIYVLFFRSSPEPAHQPEAETTVINQPANHGWATHASLSQPRDYVAVAAYNGKLYAIGGQQATDSTATVERYDPENDLWVALNEKPTAVSHVQAVSVRGYIYVPGGEDSQGNVLDIVEAYNPRTQAWRSLPALPAPRSRYALASVEGRLYLFGGWDGRSYCADVFIYDPQIEEWSEGRPLPTPRRNAGATFVDGYVYVLSGENEQGALNVNERYDPVGDSGGAWESVVPLPHAIATPAAARFITTVLVVDSQNHRAFQYTPATDAWTVMEIPDTIPLEGNAAVSLNTSVFVFGASDSTPPGALSEYYLVHNTFLPNVRNP